MAQHTVTFEVPQRKLGRADASFKVKANGKMYGTLTVSSGSVVWFPKGTSYGCKMPWRQFDRFMKEYAKRLERR